MLNIRCTLICADGAKITGELRAETPHDTVAVTYGGAAERLQDAPERTLPAVLEVFFKQEGRRLGAELASAFEGEYDNWAE